MFLVASIEVCSLSYYRLVGFSVLCTPDDLHRTHGFFWTRDSSVYSELFPVKAHIPTQLDLKKKQISFVVQ